MDDEEDDETYTAVNTAQTQSSSTITLPPLSQITTESSTSPSVLSTGAGRQYSISSVSQASFSPYFHSNQTSPAFGPQLSHVSSMPTSACPNGDTLGLGSPALKPLDSIQHPRQVAGSVSAPSSKPRPGSLRTGRSEQELDQEAMAALLMLNSDRRDWRASQEHGRQKANPGMSVRDLLTG